MNIGGVAISALFFMIIRALLIFVIGRYIIGLIIKQLSKILQKKSVDPMLQGFSISIIRILLLFVLIIAILQTFGVATSSLIAVLGAASLAVGLALQGNLSNFASGIMLIALKPFKIGDYAEAGGVSGTIAEIGIFYATLKTIDNKKIMVPNNSITSSTITNFTAYAERRVDLKIGVSYDSDIEHVKRVIREVIDAHDLILADMPILIRMGEMAESSINFTVRVWTYTENYWDVFYDLNENIKKKFDEEDILIPYPHVTVAIEK
ncbi:MAG: Mechanosensitive ion channel [Clostridiales bacterium 38_11]|nr:MAG: Mechanosensitive ion channel [Clostridiales bacterium 38_11]HBH13706.1 mechanosensitive ion channel protein MscS [Clostridiales bacterium]